MNPTQTNDKYTVGFALYRAADAMARLANETRTLADNLLELADAEAAAARAGKVLK